MRQRPARPAAGPLVAVPARGAQPEQERPPRHPGHRQAAEAPPVSSVQWWKFGEESVKER